MFKQLSSKIWSRTLSLWFRGKTITEVRVASIFARVQCACERGVAWLGAKCKGKTLLDIARHWNLLYSAQWLHCHRPLSLLIIQSKTWLSSQQPCWILKGQKCKFLKLAVLWSDSMKRNSRQFISKVSSVFLKIEVFWEGHKYLKSATLKLQNLNSCKQIL